MIIKASQFLMNFLSKIKTGALGTPVFTEERDK
jgi:hypothetical protein